MQFKGKEKRERKEKKEPKKVKDREKEKYVSYIIHQSINHYIQSNYRYTKGVNTRN